MSCSMPQKQGKTQWNENNLNKYQIFDDYYYYYYYYSDVFMIIITDLRIYQNLS